MMREIAVSAMSMTLGSAALAQNASPFNTDECRAQTGLHWCGSKAAEQGWMLKYESTSPQNLMDAFWQIEMWVRGRDAMLCEFRGVRGSALRNDCQPLREVAQ